MLIKLKLFIIFILFLSSCSSISGEDKNKITSKISEYLEQKFHRLRSLTILKTLNYQLKIKVKALTQIIGYQF